MQLSDEAEYHLKNYGDQGAGAPYDNFVLNALKSLFRLSRVLLDL